MSASLILSGKPNVRITFSYFKGCYKSPPKSPEFLHNEPFFLRSPSITQAQSSFSSPSITPVICRTFPPPAAATLTGKNLPKQNSPRNHHSKLLLEFLPDFYRGCPDFLCRYCRRREVECSRWERKKRQEGEASSFVHATVLLLPDTAHDLFPAFHILLFSASCRRNSNGFQKKRGGPCRPPRFASWIFPDRSGPLRYFTTSRPSVSVPPSVRSM